MGRHYNKVRLFNTEHEHKICGRITCGRDSMNCVKILLFWSSTREIVTVEEEKEKKKKGGGRSKMRKENGFLIIRLLSPYCPQDFA